MDVDEIKQFRFPDVLIRTLVSLFEVLSGARPSLLSRIFFRVSPLSKEIEHLRKLLDDAHTAEVVRAEEFETSNSISSEVSGAGSKVGGKAADRSASRTTASFTEEKIDYLERHLQDFKALVTQALRKSADTRAAFLVDDFYLVRGADQPYLIDYLHRLLRGTECYLKIGTVQHRTKLMVQKIKQSVLSWVRTSRL